MGSFIVNFQVKTEAVDRLKAELREIIPGRAYVAPPRDGWVAVYEESTSWQDHGAISRIGQTLSERLDTHLVAFLVHDSDVLHYWLYQRGELLDGYISYPDYFGQHVDEDANEEYRGRPDVLVRYCLPGTSEDAVRKVLQEGVRSGVFADDCLVRLGNLMGIDEPLLMVDYRSIGPDADVMPEEMDLELVESETSAELGETLEERAERLLSRVVPRGDAAAESEAEVERARRELEQNPQWRLVQAVAEGDPRRVEELLEAGADVNGPSPVMELTPLAAAVSNGRLEMVRKLIDLGADVRRPGMAGTPLMVFAIGNRANVEAMLDAGAEVDAPDTLGRTPLHRAVELLVEPEIIETLIRAGADVNAVTKSGETPLSLVGRSRHDLAQGPGLPDLEDEPAARQLHGQLAEIERLLREAGAQGP